MQKYQSLFHEKSNSEDENYLEKLVNIDEVGTVMLVSSFRGYSSSDAAVQFSWY